MLKLVKRFLGSIANFYKRITKDSTQDLSGNAPTIEVFPNSSYRIALDELCLRNGLNSKDLVLNMKKSIESDFQKAKELTEKANEMNNEATKIFNEAIRIANENYANAKAAAREVSDESITISKKADISSKSYYLLATESDINNSK